MLPFMSKTTGNSAKKRKMEVTQLLRFLFFRFFHRSISIPRVQLHWEKERFDIVISLSLSKYRQSNRCKNKTKISCYLLACLLSNFFRVIFNQFSWGQIKQQTLLATHVQKSLSLIDIELWLGQYVHFFIRTTILGSAWLVLQFLAIFWLKLSEIVPRFIEIHWIYYHFC